MILNSFGQLNNFVDSLEVIFKQMGILLTRDDYLNKLGQVLILILNVAKRFIGNMKDAEDEEEKQANEEVLGKSNKIFRFVGKQSKACLRNGLKIVKQLYAKFNYAEEFAQPFSQLLYQEVVEDQLDLFKDMYVSEKSQLVEILTLGWSSHAVCMQNYSRYPRVIPSLLGMLQTDRQLDPLVV